MLDVVESPFVGEVRPRRWTRREYAQMVAAGLLREEDRVELIDGEVLVMSPVGAEHVRCTILVVEALRRAFGDRFTIGCQFPLAVGPRDEPQPDVYVVPGRPRELARKRKDHPTSARLVVEVADSSLPFDRTVKSRIYARARVPDYWIVDLTSRRLEVRRGPGRDGYRSTTILSADAVVRPLGRPRSKIRVADLLP